MCLRARVCQHRFGIQIQRVDFQSAPKFILYLCICTVHCAHGVQIILFPQIQQLNTFEIQTDV